MEDGWSSGSTRSRAASSSVPASTPTSDEQRALVASGAEVVDRRAPPGRPLEEGGGVAARLLPKGIKLLPNTAGCYTADEAIRTAGSRASSAWATS